jgi:hypothetical protein
MDEKFYGYLPSKLHGGQEDEVVGGLAALYVKGRVERMSGTNVSPSHTR